MRAKPGDEVQIWPPWAERARLFIEAVPVRTEEDLRAADYPGVDRVWLLALTRSPRNGVGKAREALRARGATAGERVRFGSLELEPWELHGPRVLAGLTGSREEHEVDYVSRPCVLVRLPGRFSARGPVRVEVRADGSVLGELTVPPTEPPAPGWRKLDVPAPAGDRLYEIAASASDTDRPFCVAAWVTDR